MNKRTVRYYIQKGLVDRPEGVGKGAFYSHTHLEQLLAIRKWKTAGLSLERIQDILATEKEGGDGDQLYHRPCPKKTRVRSRSGATCLLTTALNFTSNPGEPD